MDTLNQYLYRGTKPRPMPAPGPKRISTPAGHRLSTIVETNNNNNPRPANRSLAQRLHIGTPPRASFEKRPPSYATLDGLAAGDFELAGSKPPQSGIREKLRGRGGWKRVALILGLVIFIIIALGVGLGVGLSHNGGGSDHGKSGSSKPEPFPAGAWTFDTFLTDISTSCTSQPLAWDCFPFKEYSPADPVNSVAPFTWIIKSSASSSSSSSPQLLISSAADPWSTTFSNIPLTLRDVNTQNEHYFFTVQNLSKVVLPQISLTGDQNRTTCFFNETTMQASLYTKKEANLVTSDRLKRSYSVKRALAMLNGPIFESWNHALQVEMIAHGGSGVPSCYKTYNQQPVGDPIPIPAESSSSTCRCGYENFRSGNG